MIDENVLNGLRRKFPNIHPLIFLRSKERSKTAGELFDILDFRPETFPIVWSEDKRMWVSTNDLFQAKTLEKGK